MQKTNYPALYTLIIVFFFWGFIAAGNSIFIPFCKHFFHLDQFQSQLVDFSFYGAYYCGALLLFIFNCSQGKDLISQWGYKKSIIYGLLFSSLGAIIMIVAIFVNNFYGMLIGLFTVALGFSIQQIAAQPFAISLGDPLTGNTRINLGGGVNSFGTMIGPLIIGFTLFGSSEAITDEMIAKLDLTKIIILYSIISLLFIIAASLFKFSKSVPTGVSNENIEKSYKALSSLIITTGLLIIMFTPVFNSYHSKKANEINLLEKKIKQENKKINYLKNEITLIKQQISYPTNNKTIVLLEKQINNIKKIIKPNKYHILNIKESLEKYRISFLLGALLIIILSLSLSNFFAQKNPKGWGAMQYPQLVLGMLAIFIYVGIEVSIGSNLGELLKQTKFGAYNSSEIAPFISMYWGGLMIGRWTGAINAFNIKKYQIKKILMFIIPITAFILILFFNFIAKYNISKLYLYILCVIIQIVAFQLSEDKPIKSLLIFGGLGMISMIIGMSTTGIISVYSFLSGGLFCSILWPCIFTLSINGLGQYTAQGSAFLIMMILGGGIIPPIQGKLSDVIGIHYSFVIDLLGFAYLVFFALIIPNILKKQNIYLKNN